MKNNRHIVDFKTWCPRCVHKDESEFDMESTCYDCVAEPINEESHKPVLFEDADSSKNQTS